MQNTPHEWTLLQKIRNKVHRANNQTVVPLGDDAFVFKNFPGYSVICQDMLVENVHFKLDYFSAANLGAKSLAVNLSDIAAMGARPHFVHVSLALPQKINESWLDQFYNGMTEMADKFACSIVGGDLTRSDDKLIIDVNVHGSCEHPFTRKGTQAGDLLLSSGPLGLSRAGLQALLENTSGYGLAKQKHLSPQPRLDLVTQLQEHRHVVHALMDCSDGLVNDALQLCPADLSLNIFTERLPIHEETHKMALAKNQRAVDFALWGGEDYELLMTVPAAEVAKFSNWHVLGEFTAGRGIFISEESERKEITHFKGWQHF